VLHYCKGLEHLTFDIIPAYKSFENLCEYFEDENCNLNTLRSLRTFRILFSLNPASPFFSKRAVAYIESNPPDLWDFERQATINPKKEEVISLLQNAITTKITQPQELGDDLLEHVKDQVEPDFEDYKDEFEINFMLEELEVAVDTGRVESGAEV
jgi:hypothetical protein